MPSLTLLTPTGFRPQAWALCQRWMAAQDYSGPVRWLVVDDGPVAQEVTLEREGWRIEVLRPEPFWQSGQNTQARNLLCGLAQVEDGAPLLIIEDDDYYTPDWLSTASAALQQHDLVGETRMMYYNIQYRQWLQHSNANHASLCATGVKGTALTALRAVCSPQIRYADLALWRSYRGRRHLFSGARVTGIKGLPGRGGICQAHRQNFASHSKDDSGKRLIQRIGAEAAECYLSLRVRPR